ncbi:hypothetical protein SteCoe_262 [Stentor coeruleus]|uniref:DUF8019 domain-containing protein n=1 Tax=Stentor coeruleus TaxID=5963 RepID=A0A1R2D4F2_9CILI|nr:hypothetical protein SteCoe_262 [Stentor coeruleus]
MIGWWTFDDKFGHDYSPNTNPMINVLKSGPAMNSQGSSLICDGESYGLIPHSSSYDVNELSVVFWVFLTQDSTGDWRSIFHKGSTSQELTPTVLLWPKERRLHVRASTQFSWNEGLDSVAILRLRRWYMITIVGSGQLLQLYLNGLLDSQVILRGPLKFNRGDIYIGKDPWHSGFKGYFDDLRLYNKPLHEKDLLPLALPAVPITFVSGVMLGCQLCNYDLALSACLDNFHMCSLEELYAGAFEMARSMGWFRFTAEVWTRNTDDQDTTTSDEMQDPDLFKLGLCCRDY